MPNRPVNPNDPPNPPDVTVESVFGAQAGNPPILPADEEATPEMEQEEGETLPAPETPPPDAPPIEIA
jgi:hypothetical protein